MAGDPRFSSFHAGDLRALGEAGFGDHTSQANELVAAEFPQECLMTEPPTWHPSQLDKLVALAGPAPEATSRRLVASHGLAP